MKNTFFSLMLLASGMISFSSCSNDIAEEAMEDLTQGIQPGTPMNFALDFGDHSQKSGKRRIKYDDSNFAGASVPFAFEVGDQIGVECPDAEKMSQEGESRASKGVYKVISTSNIYNKPNYVSDLEAVTNDYLYWSTANLHRVFVACPAGKLTLTSEIKEIEGNPIEFTRDFEGKIEPVQQGKVVEDKIRIDGSAVDGYRCVDRDNMIFAGSWCYYREDIDALMMQYLPIPMAPCFTSLDVIFKKAESEVANVTIKSVSVKVELPTDATIEDIKIAGECSGTVENGRDGFIVVKEINPKENATNTVTLELGENENGYQWAQDKPLSTVLIMFPWPEPKNEGGGATYTKTFPATLKVVYQYQGEDVQTKYMDITGEYGINARNRVIVPTLPRKSQTNS